MLADARARGVERFVNLGDSLYGPLDPAGTCALLRQLDIPSTTIRGNQDRILFEGDASLEFEAAARAAVDGGRPEWAVALRTGWARARSMDARST